jgi:hypothetical protein
LYADGGFQPSLEKGNVILGAEQLVVVGTGEYASERYLLGKDASIRIPLMQERLNVAFGSRGKNKIVGNIAAQRGKDLRIIFQQFGADGKPVRSWGGAPPDGQKMNDLLTIRVRQAGKELPIYLEYDKMIWSGLSWGAAELRQGGFDPAIRVEIYCASAEKDELRLEARVYAVGY